MKIFRSFEELKQSPISRPVITWGVFDGVHRGHQFLFRHLIRWAKKLKSPTLIITFQNHPARVIKGREEPLFLASLEHRLLLFQQLGIDACLILEFTKRFSQLTAEQYLGRIIKDIKPAGIVVTKDIAFGQGGRGDVHLIQETIKSTQTKLQVIDTLRVNDAGRTTQSAQRPAISSSLIRRAITTGNLTSAARMLGRPVAILGTIVHGEGRGRQLGFPTANLDPHHEIMPPNGVYIARATIYPNGMSAEVPRTGTQAEGSQFLTYSRPYKALVNIGTRPTFHLAGDIGIEVYLKGYTQKGWPALRSPSATAKGEGGNYLYGKDMLVEIICKIRSERKFPDAKALVKQIQSDLKKLARKRI